MKSKIQKSNYISMTIHEIYSPDRAVTDFALKEIMLGVTLNLNKGKAKVRKAIIKKINDSIKNGYTVANSINDKKSLEFRRKIESVIDSEFVYLKRTLVSYIKDTRKEYKTLSTWEDLQAFSNKVNKGKEVKLDKSKSQAINIVHKDVTSIVLKDTFPSIVDVFSTISVGEISLSIVTGGIMWVTIQRLTRRIISTQIKQILSEFLNRFLEVEERNFKGFYT